MVKGSIEYGRIWEINSKTSRWIKLGRNCVLLRALILARSNRRGCVYQEMSQAFKRVQGRCLGRPATMYFNDNASEYRIK
jgi:hypothetical protein